MTSSESTDTFYPQYCFELSTTVGTWCPLRATDIGALQSHPGFQGQDVWFHGNHPIKWVRVAGVLVAIDDFYGRRIYTVDDSSGAHIECVTSLQPPAPAVTPFTTSADAKAAEAKAAEAATAATKAPGPEIPDGLDVGDVVYVKGGLKLFRDQKQIHVEKISRFRCTEQEIDFWTKVQQFHRDILSKPWALGQEEIRRCRKQAEGYEAEVKRKGKGKLRAAVRGQDGGNLQKTAKDTASGGKRKLTGLEQRATIANSRQVDASESLDTARRRKVTGLEGKAVPVVTERREVGVSDKVRRPKSTGLEERAVPVLFRNEDADEYPEIGRKRWTGLEKKAIPVPSQPDERSGGPSSAAQKSRGLEGKTATARVRPEKTGDSPMATSRKKVTGLERRPRPPTTQNTDQILPLQGSYDALGL